MTIYRVRVALLEVEPAIWRRIELSSQTTLKQFHLVLQIAMGWENCHMHAFEMASLRFGVPDGKGDPHDKTTSENGIRLAQALLGEGSTLLYNYDFGDDWNHEITLEAVLPPAVDTTYPRVLNGARSCPPEDCGGPPGYDDLLRILKNPRHKEHKQTRAWVGRKFDPEAFDLEDTNRRLRTNRALAAKP